MSALSDQYAIALFELALEMDAVDTIDQALSRLLKEDTGELEAFFLHPKITKAVKKETITAMGFPSLFKDFLSVLIDNNRFLLLKDIQACYQALKETQKEAMRVYVYSKTALSQSRLATLKQEYEKKYHRHITMENIIDETIIGGLRFEFQGFVVNNTINQSLQQLKAYLTK